MKHMTLITSLPKQAQTDGGITICSDIGNDFQAQLCFLTELLTSFFLPLFELKVSTDPNA